MNLGNANCAPGPQLWKLQGNYKETNKNNQSKTKPRIK